MTPLLEISGLEVTIEGQHRKAIPLQGVNLSVNRGDTVGLVGESGCGKSMTLRAVLSLLPTGGRVSGGDIYWKERSILDMHSEELQRFRGSEVAMIFQDPVAALNPMLTVGDQVVDAYEANGRPDEDAERVVIDTLRGLDFSDPLQVMRRHPHQLSGGMAQRVNIAMALVCGPDLLLADEPTTGLDVTTQLRVLELLEKQVDRNDTSLLFISHDLRVVGRVSDTIGVMYAGRIVEFGTREQVTTDPMHPYTRALLDCADLSPGRTPKSIPGVVPSPTSRHALCPFRQRCEKRGPLCDSEFPPTITLDGARQVECHYPQDHG